MRSKAFRPSNGKITRLELHPTHPWLATADASDNVVVWDWQHRQVVYELNAGGVDARRLVDAKLQKLAEGEAERKVKIGEAIRGGSVKQIKFYDEDVCFWRMWLNCSAAAEAPVAVNQHFTPAGGFQSVRGRHFLVICCENKIIFLDMVTMRSTDVPKQFFENKSPLCMEFIPRSAAGDGPLVGFGGSDGVIRVLSMTIWQVVRKYVGGHKGSVSCLMTFLSSSGETLLVSGGSDGLIVLWTAENLHESREVSPKQSIKAHDGGVYAIELLRVLGGAPQLVSIGADKTLAVWDTVSFKDLKRIKPVAKVACCSLGSWCHPRFPGHDILTCVKDSNIWAIQNSTFSAIARPLCDLSSHVPPALFAANKKLKCYCVAVHPLQPDLVATGTNLGVILSEFDSGALPAACAIPPTPGSKEHVAAFVVEKEIRLLTFQPSIPINANMGGTGAITDSIHPRQESLEASLQVKQTRRPVSSVPYDGYSILSVSKSGKYIAVVCPAEPHFAIYRVSDWAVIDSGAAKYFAWDTCKERYALLEASTIPRYPQLTKGKKAKEAAAVAAAAVAAAASAAASATVQVRIILDDGSANQLTRAIEGRTEPVAGLQGGALLGVTYKFPLRMSFSNIAAVSAVQSVATLSGRAPSFSRTDDASGRGNFQLYSWETFKPVGDLLPEPEWTSWDPTVEYCAFGYPDYVGISSLRPQYRYLGNVAIVGSTGGVWHRRQLFLATSTTIECVFVDAGVSALDLEVKRRKEEMKVKDSQAKALAEHGELALITVETSKAVPQEKIPLRPPMLQVVRLASFQHAPTIPPVMALFKRTKNESEEPLASKTVEERRSAAEVAVAGGGVAVAMARLPPEQKRPVGPLVVIGVRDGVLWLIDRYMSAHAIGLGHPGIRCRCLAAHGDAITAVKWAARLGREHHDDLAQFMLGMGYAAEALHLPGISKMLEFELALQSNDLKRGLQCLLTLSNSRKIGQEIDGSNEPTGLLSLQSTDVPTGDSVQGIIKYAKEFLRLIDAADATGQTQIASHALRQLAAAGAVKGALQPSDLRGLALRLASHGELTRLAVLANMLIATGQGREAALAAALLGDSALSEKSWEETGMHAEAALHAQAHGRPALKKIIQSWNQALEKELKVSTNMSALALTQASSKASTDDIILKELSETKRKPLVEIVPPGNVILGGPIAALSKPPAIKPAPQTSQPLLLEGPPGTAAPQLDSSQPQLLASGVPVTLLSTPSLIVAHQDPVLAALTQPATNANVQEGPDLPTSLAFSGSDTESLMSLQSAPQVALPSSTLSVPTNLPSITVFPGTNLSNSDTMSLMTLQVAPSIPTSSDTSLVLNSISSSTVPSVQLSGSILPSATAVGIPTYAPQTGGPPDLTMAGNTETKAAESATTSRPTGPSVAALVDFFS